LILHEFTQSMKTQNVLFHPSNTEELNVLKAIAKELKIQFEIISKEKVSNDFKNELTEAFNDIKLYEQGKKKLKSAKDLLDEL
jgi:7-cyano-7-deazaguanine synthase in queuosine biosynthesis